MKNVCKAFGNLNRARSAKVPLLIVALAAAIVFSMAVTLASCGDEGGPSGGGGGGGNSGWPPNSLLSQWGLSGMPAPAGATNIMYGSASSTALTITFAGTSATDAAVPRWLENNGWTFGWESNFYKVYEKPPFRAMYYWDQDFGQGRSRSLGVVYD